MSSVSIHSVGSMLFFLKWRIDVSEGASSSQENVELEHEMLWHYRKDNDNDLLLIEDHGPC